MARGTDTGNFVMLLIGAAVVGTFFGDWAFKAVLWIGMIAMGVGAVVYILQSWGINLDATPNAEAGRPVLPPKKFKASMPHELPQLASAVARRDRRQVEHLVLNRNLSPFEKTVWKGEVISADQLASRIGFKAAVDFFKEWSAKGSAARFPSSASE